MEENNENVVEETTQEQTVETVDESKFISADDDDVIKVDLSKPIENENQEEEPTAEVDAGATDDSRVVGSNEDAEPVQEQEKVQPKAEAQEQPVLEEIAEEEVEEKAEELAEEVEEAIAQAEQTGKPLPENIQKLVDFMEETGGDLEDYVRLNQDYDKLDDMSIVTEYYKQTKSHLDLEEINFLIDESFSIDEEEDDDKDIRKKKIAFKEQVAEAKAYLDGRKSKYYEEIKAGSKLTTEQQKAVDFFNRYNKESEESTKTVKRNSDIFEKKTNSLFNNKFKGFEYSVGEKKYRFNVKDVNSVKAKQSDLNAFMSKFVDENKSLSDAAGYHKALFTAMNADAIANHFYEQGKADALKQSVAKSKNINMDPRQSHKNFEAGGMKVKVLGDNTSDFKFKINKK